MKFPTMRLVIARAVMSNCFEDVPVCGRNSVVIKCVILSAALDDIESRGTSSTGCLMVVPQLDAVLGEAMELTLWLLPSL